MRRWGAFSVLCFLACTGPGAGRDASVGRRDAVVPRVDAGIPEARCDAPALADVSSPTSTVGDGTAASCPPTDQRGEPRNEPCTLGAVE